MHKYDVCILGGGPASLILCNLLKSLGISVVSIGPQKYDSLLPKLIQGKLINILPVFPVKNNEFCSNIFSTSLNLFPNLRIEHPESKNYQIKDNSESDFTKINLSKNEKLSKIIGNKLFGDQMFIKSLPLLEDKVKRHYGNDKPTFTRSGFIKGLSPYYHLLSSFDNVLFIKAVINYISFEEKSVHFHSLEKGVIQYKYLISTINVESLLNLAELSCNFNLRYEGARFHLYEIDIDLGTNRLIYDTDPSSPLVRIFTPYHGMLLVQIRKSFDEHTNICEIKESIFRLLGVSFNLKKILENNFSKCYPLDISNFKHFNEMKNKIIRDYDVLLFGRHGNFEYKDLHELDWSIVNSISKKIHNVKNHYT